MIVTGHEPNVATPMGIEVVDYPTHIGITVEGMERNNTVVITPDQAIALGNALIRRGKAMSEEIRKSLDPKEEN